MASTRAAPGLTQRSDRFLMAWLGMRLPCSGSASPSGTDTAARWVPDTASRFRDDKADREASATLDGR